MIADGTGRAAIERAGLRDRRPRDDAALVRHRCARDHRRGRATQDAAAGVAPDDTCGARRRRSRRALGRRPRGRRRALRQLAADDEPVPKLEAEAEDAEPVTMPFEDEPLDEEIVGRDAGRTAATTCSATWPRPAPRPPTTARTTSSPTSRRPVGAPRTVSRRLRGARRPQLAGARLGRGRRRPRSPRTERRRARRARGVPHRARAGRGRARQPADRRGAVRLLAGRPSSWWRRASSSACMAQASPPAGDRGRPRDGRADHRRRVLPGRERRCSRCSRSA